MKVEVFEIEEQDETSDCASIETDAVALIAELGLTGQSKLLVECDGAETRIPYARMSTAEEAVYQTLFPVATPLDTFEAGLIPVRVLQLVRQARLMFDELVVWHSRYSSADPLLIGSRKKGSGSERYLIARWGDSLDSFAVQEKAARAKLKAEYKGRAEEGLARCEAALKSLDALVDKKLRGDWVNIPC
jgi:hypothetical protein